MATVSDLVTAALRKIGVVAEDETASADAMSNGVDTLNRMIHGWELRGVDLSWTDQVSTDTFALADQYHEGIVYLLAQRLSPDFEVPAAFDADDWFRTFQAANITVTAATIPTALSRMPSQHWPKSNLRGWRT